MKALIGVLGQSNELGVARKSDGVTAIDLDYARSGFPQSNLLNNPIAGQGRGYWAIFTEKMYNKYGLYAEVRPTPVSGTSIADDWCGRAAGDNHVLNHTEVGFDPNGYFANINTQMDINGYDEKWLFIIIGQRDNSANTSRTDFAQAHINATEWAFVNGIDNVFMGLTIHSKLDVSNWYATNLSPGVDDALANYTNNTKVHKGANQFIELGAIPNIVLWDDNHAQEPTITQMAETWVNAIGSYLRK